MEDRKKMHQFPSKPGASKEGKCLFVSSVFIRGIKNASAVIASHNYELAKNDVDFVLKLFACLRFFLAWIFFSLWGIFKQKQSLYCLFLPGEILGTFRMWIYAWCLHTALRDTIYFDKRQYFLPPSVRITPQMHHLSVHPSVQSSVTLLQDMIIKASLIIITNTLLLFYPLYQMLIDRDEMEMIAYPGI